MGIKFNPFTSTFDFTGSGGAGGNSFGVVQVPSGTNPTATIPTDTLTLTSSDSSVTITGNSATDTIDLKSSFPVTTKGDLFGYSTVAARLPVGTNGQVLTADSTQTLGLKWVANAAVDPQPARYGFTNNGTFNLTNSNPIIFDRMFFDPNAALDLTTGIWTAPSSGTWEFRLEIQVVPGNDYAAGDFMDISFMINGANNRELYYPLPYPLTVASGAEIPMVLTLIAPLTVGDLVKTNWVSNKAGAYLLHFGQGLEQALFIKKVSN